MDQAIGCSVRGQRGVTLMELVVTLALFGMIMVGVMGVWQKTQESYFVGSDIAEIQQNVRSAIDFMVRELRATGRDVTVCAFDYAGGTGLDDCTGAKPANCLAKIGGGYVSCTGRFAIPQAREDLIQIRSDRNDNGTIAIVGSDPPEEDVTYALSPPAAPPPGGCPAGGSCIVRTERGVTSAMVAVDISGLQFVYYPRPGFPPCAQVPPDNPCPRFGWSVSPDQFTRDNIGRIGISVTAQSVIGGQLVKKTLTTDVILRNRYSN